MRIIEEQKLDRTELDLWTPREVAKLLALVENEKRYYQGVLAEMPAPLAVADGDLTLASVNRAFRAMFPRKGSSDSSAGQKMVPEALASHVKGFFETSDALSEVTVRLCAAEENTLSDWKLLLVRLPEGQSSHREVLLLLKRAGVESNPLGRLLDENGMAAWSMDAASYETRFWNDGGSVREKADWGARIHPGDASRVQWVYEAVLESGTPAVVEYRAAAADGSVRWLADSIRPDKKAGQIDVVTTTETMRRARMKQLIQTREMQASMRLAGQVAHEFNNLWMIVNGYAEVLEERLGNDAEARSGLDEIVKAAQRGIDSTRPLLEFGRPAAVQSKPCDLHTLVQDANLDVDMRLAAGGAPIQANAQKVVNALGMLTAFAQARLKQGERLLVETARETIISDIGGDLPKGQFISIAIHPVRGVTQTMFEQWCELFFAEFDKSVSFGFASMYCQMMAMGVMVELDQIGPETGAFFLRFPLTGSPEPVRVPAETVRPEPVAPPVAPPVPPKREKVLVVDDEESIRRLVARILSREGYEVVQVQNGAEALQAVAAVPPFDLMITDIHMPDIEGPALAAKFRETQKDVKVLYVSGFAEDPRMLSPGHLPPGDGFLQKPFTVTSLLAAVKTLISVEKS
ncbi:MAG: response regulator [Candidatus Solibacter usitatus]|nr:response regulator [Candidatus Solibacter usitatus]